MCELTIDKLILDLVGSKWTGVSIEYNKSGWVVSICRIPFSITGCCIKTNITFQYPTNAVEALTVAKKFEKPGYYVIRKPIKMPGFSLKKSDEEEG